MTTYEFDVQRERVRSAATVDDLLNLIAQYETTAVEAPASRWIHHLLGYAYAELTARRTHNRA